MTQLEKAHAQQRRPNAAKRKKKKGRAQSNIEESRKDKVRRRGRRNMSQQSIGKQRNKKQNHYRNKDSNRCGTQEKRA